MRKALILSSAALLALVACSKVDAPVESQREISFQVAKYLQTRASGVKYENGNFGTYSWYNAEDPFMTNEEVGEVGGQWKTVNHTFFWPKTGSIDFISYSPFAGTNAVAGTVPSVTNNGGEYTLAYSRYTVGEDDIMYADLATCSSNIDDVTDDAATGTTDSGYQGVPTLFHHALAKVSFQVQANFTEYGEGNDKTTWELTVTSAKLGGIYSTGNCSLTWNASDGAWDKPEGNVWTNPSNPIDDKELVSGNGLILTTEPQDLASVANYVLPQTLVAGAQTLSLKVHIKTTLSNGNILEEDYESGALDLVSIASLTAWEMNQNIVYTIKIKPTASTPDDPNPDNPDDVIILFDPAVADWQNIESGITIQL